MDEVAPLKMSLFHFWDAHSLWTLHTAIYVDFFPHSYNMQKRTVLLFRIVVRSNLLMITKQPENAGLHAWRSTKNAYGDQSWQSQKVTEMQPLWLTVWWGHNNQVRCSVKGDFLNCACVHTYFLHRGWVAGLAKAFNIARPGRPGLVSLIFISSSCPCSYHELVDWLSEITNTLAQEAGDFPFVPLPSLFAAKLCNTIQPSASRSVTKGIHASCILKMHY